jgi:apolipoprotein N-acyltransferase
MLPFLQSASLFGSYFVSFLIVAVNGLLAYAILYRPRAALCGMLAAVLFCSNLLYGVADTLITPKAEKTLRVAVIQGNIDSHDKWSGDSYRKTVEIYGELTRRAAEEGAELVVWPETTLPYDLSYQNDRRKFVSSLARECNVTLIVGALYYDEMDRNYNALYLVDPDGTVRDEYYAKRHLVPFGEYVPMRNVIMTLIPPLANLSALGDDVSPGTDPALFETEWGKLGSLICFDSIYEQLTLDSVREGASLMMISSNDSWFYDSAAVYQHQAQSQLRAIESGRYVVRSANTGISSVITPDGEPIAWIDPLECGYAVAEVGIIETRTLYSIVGNLFVYLNVAFVAGAFAWSVYLNRKKKHDVAEQTE